MVEELTTQQRAAVYNRGGKLLVSAAAGSGKTKVLVDRLLSYILDPVKPANIDDFLIITFTKAAAAELRLKIAQKISEHIAEYPDNHHLQKQMQRLYLANISTVDSFCTEILRENAYRLNIPSDFRVLEDTDSKQLMLEAVEIILNIAYQKIDEDEDIRNFLDTQGLGRNDKQIPPILLSVYRAARCHMDPDGWLSWCEAQAEAEGIIDASETVWGTYLISRLYSVVDATITALENVTKAAVENGEMPKVVQYLEEYIQQFRYIRSLKKWDDICAFTGIEYGRVTFPKNCSDLKLCEQIKVIREYARTDVQAILQYFTNSSQQVISDLRESGTSVKGLIKIVRMFVREYDRQKRIRKSLDFSDIEHKMLDLLYGKSRSGITVFARELGVRYREVMVDEYQDTNAVQDAIYEALTGTQQNLFMVGDVKQSIYQFRLADPSIFIDKYNKFVNTEAAQPGEGRKISLSKNFRSAGGVISAVNDVFTETMSPKIGGLYYTVDEMLHQGRKHSDIPEPEVEFYAIDADESYADDEAKFVADRISQLIDGTHMVQDGDALRPIIVDDIVILLRSPKTSGSYFAYALEQKGIPCVMDGGIDLLQTEEISVLVSLLQVVLNPQQDIPLVAVMCSRIFGFTADEIAKIRVLDRYSSIYDTLRKSTSDKVKRFLSVIEKLRYDVQIYKLTELLAHVLEQTNFKSIYNAMPDGDERSVHIDQFCLLLYNFAGTGQRDLSHFLDYLKTFEEEGLEIGKDQTVNGAVRIMTIHSSKGLEYPVVFLSALSRELNKTSSRKPVLCHKDFGLGLNFVDTKRRVRYPTLAKNAIAERILEDSLSEELRVLYVAMTRAKDRLIMTYGKRKLDDKLITLGLRMEVTPCDHMKQSVAAIGDWILQTALGKTEAGELHKLSGNLTFSKVSNYPWLIKVVKVDSTEDVEDAVAEAECRLENVNLCEIAAGLQFVYPYVEATRIPSKQTATQLKGRNKDFEVAENTKQKFKTNFRRPAFVATKQSATVKGEVVHLFLQFAQYEHCKNIPGIRAEISRLINGNLITKEQAEIINCEKLLPFFQSDFCQKIIAAGSNALREFKFSLLVDAKQYSDGVDDEQILLQGVVDCALIEPDGITVLDFKTDYVTKESISAVKERYRMQVEAYAKALERIFNKPVKKTFLYLFHLGQFVDM